ncbi:N-acetylgalactosamine-specific enzyme IIC component of PTS [Escherichia coli]|nr:N-acetylgalactosamine-specific enzyme IIC component of PTS [Escherichia coli]
MHRPVVLGPLVGLVLGDLHTGILTGGTLELVWMGLAPLAGAQPPNVIIGTIVGTAFAITTGVKPDVAVGVAVPFAVAVQMGITFLFSVMSGVMSRCDRMAENADTRGIGTRELSGTAGTRHFLFSLRFPAYLLRRGTCKNHH